MVLSIYRKYKQLIWYSIALAALLVVLQLLEYRFLILDYAMEIYVSAIAIVFTSLGIWLAIKLTKPKVKTVLVEKTLYVAEPVEFTPNQHEISRLNLSRRELEVLQLMAEGLSNQEISERLFVSLNTVKTHSSKVFEKMEVKRRTQAVEMCRRLQIIPKQ